MNNWKEVTLEPNKSLKFAIKILDQNFNNISAYTKKKYKFFSKEVESDLWGHQEIRINFHRVTYRHEDVNTDEWDPAWHIYITCDRYYLRDKNDFSAFKRYFEERFDERLPSSIIKIPKIEDFGLHFRSCLPSFS